ncbi:hypothetical protein [Phyllobacterium bourgognense]|uniref:1,4-alpha-glucan branching enzyme n=1 Tax=Phyllobacterium bourgognense TaxID=314236 RepID=A0A368YNT3_9HYPH|nr:hypothetical protein [Phyllobacterium bourgognense]RCW81892.1 hypothetical protein C7476_10974 [Phyllobacterium bourgognense]
MSSTQSTTDHKLIRKWVEARDGRPSKVAGRDEGGILRIDFGEREETLEKMSWDDFFEVFDDRQLAFLYQEKTEDGKPSRFNKFVSRKDN